MSESRVPENGMHGLIGGRWGQRATTLEIQRSTKVTTLHRATVSRQVVNRSTSGLPHPQSRRVCRYGSAGAQCARSVELPNLAMAGCRSAFLPINSEQ